MNIGLLFKFSCISLKKHKARSFLTILGIIIGIASIIATLAIGKGAEEKTRKQFLALGDNYIFLSSGNWAMEGKTTTKKRKKAPYFRYKDVRIIKKLCKGLKEISPWDSAKDVISYETNSLQVELKGGNEKFLKILSRKVKRGIFYNKNHVKRGVRVVVLGDRTARELFKFEDPIGKTVLIKGKPFNVIGVLEKIENYFGFHDPNYDVLMPNKSLKRHIHNANNDIVGAIIMSAPTKESTPILVRKLAQLMRFRRKIQSGEPDNFVIQDQASILKAAQSASHTIKLLLLIIASISLMVGGIGIMNIMLVSVSERKKEIGIRMALGAKRTMILKQFLIEAVLLCLAGGLIGMFLGVSIPYIIAYFTKWNPIVTLSSILISFFTASVVGVFFGFYPARKAANLNPVDALMER